MDLKAVGTPTIFQNATLGTTPNDALATLSNGPFRTLSLFDQEWVSPFGALVV